MKLSKIVGAATAGLAVATISASTAAITLGGVTLGEPVVTVVAGLGAPGLVESTDEGHEWRWFDTSGLDVDLLTDDSLAVRQILVARPEALGGKAPPLVQPSAYPYLEMPAFSAEAAMQKSGASSVREPGSAASVWRVGDDYLVLELVNHSVRKILALDRDAAARAGYVGTPQPFGVFHAPRLLQQYPVDYPRRAVEQRASGVVVVRAEIAATGAVTGVSVIVSSGNVDIDAAEVLSIRNSKFRPAECHEQPCSGVYLDREEYTLGS